jgi:hypothetical protein
MAIISFVNWLCVAGFGGSGAAPFFPSTTVNLLALLASLILFFS